MSERHGLVILCAVGFVVAVGAAHGQESYHYVIESTGTATVDAAPATIVFQLDIFPSGAGSVALAEQARQFENAVRAEVRNRELRPAQIAFSGLNYTHPGQLGPNASVFLRFTASTYTVGDDSGERYAALRDQIAGIAAEANAVKRAVRYEVTEPDQVEAAAVARAVEKAYPSAKAAADVMNARIVSVGNVSVGTPVWSTPESPPADYNLRRIKCTVAVNVSYLYTPAT